MRAVSSVLLALVLVGTLVELSCVAGERHRSAQPSAAPAAIFRPTPMVDPVVDPPSMSEVDAEEIVEIAASPALTR